MKTQNQNTTGEIYPFSVPEIRKKKLSERTVREEYQLARYEKRQPNCVYCQAPLEVNQTMYDFLKWQWDKIEKSYTLRNGILYHDADKPYCAKCETSDADFVDHHFISY